MHHVSAVRRSLLHIDLRGRTFDGPRSRHCAKGREIRGSISGKGPQEQRTLQVVPDFSSNRHWPRLTKSDRLGAARDIAQDQCRMVGSFQPGSKLRS